MSNEKVIIFETNLFDGKLANSVMGFAYLDVSQIKRLLQVMSLPSSGLPNAAILHFRWWPEEEIRVQVVNLAIGENDTIRLCHGSKGDAVRTVRFTRDALHRISKSSIIHKFHMIGASELFESRATEMIGKLNWHYYKGQA